MPRAEASAAVERIVTAALRRVDAETARHGRPVEVVLPEWRGGRQFGKALLASRATTFTEWQAAVAQLRAALALRGIPLRLARIGTVPRSPAGRAEAAARRPGRRLGLKINPDSIGWAVLDLERETGPAESGEESIP